MIVETNDLLPDGSTVTHWVLRNASGANIAIMARGATLLSVLVPDRNGRLDDVCFAHPVPADYLSGRHFLGPVVGRFANRIAGGRFEIDGCGYQLLQNEGNNALHGGPDGFDRRLWAGMIVATPEGDGIRLSLQSDDGDQGYPGTLAVSITYIWTDDNRLITDFAATTDTPTPVNILLHGYWNLSSDPDEGIDNHHLEIVADSYLPVDRQGIPGGKIWPVTGTPFEFRTAPALGERLRMLQQDTDRRGYDHCWVITGTGLRRAALLCHPASGRTMTIETDRPGLQVYTANHFDATISARGGRRSVPHCAIALETQAFPDAPNQPLFPDAILREGQMWRSRTVYSFGIR